MGTKKSTYSVYGPSKKSCQDDKICFFLSNIFLGKSTKVCYVFQTVLGIRFLKFSLQLLIFSGFDSSSYTRELTKVR